MKEETETIVLEAKQEVVDQYEEEMSNMAKMYKTQIEVKLIKTAHYTDNFFRTW